MEEELSDLAKEIIALLVFEETYGNIVAELSHASHYAVADEVKILIGKDIVKPCKDLHTGKTSGFIYDSDHMKDYSFRLTAKGMTLLETFLKE
jgi:hypothetical protein